MDKLKNIDWKQIGINHGEKIGAVIVVLLAVFALWSSRWSSEWGRGDKTVTQLEDKAQATLDTLLVSEWPTEKTSGAEQGEWQFMDIADIGDRATRMGKAVGFEKYLFTTELVWPLKPQRKKRSRLELSPPEDVVLAVVTDSFALKKSEEDKKDGEKSDEEDKKDGDDKKNEEETIFRGSKASSGTGAGGTNNGRSASGGGGNTGLGGGDSGGGLGGLGGGGLGGGGLGGGNSLDDKEKGKGRSSSGGGRGAGGLGGGGLGGGGLGGGDALGGNSGIGGSGFAQAPANFKAEGHRVVTVRAIVDTYRQREQLARSLHLPFSHPLVSNSLKYLDYKIQRKVAVPGDEPWSGEWEDVDVQVAIDMIAKADGRDNEVVDREVTNVAMTMPLPPRLVQPWGKEASHPRIEDFTLSESQIERQRKQDELIRKHYEEFMKKNKNKKGGRRKTGGWSKSNVDLNSMKDKLLKDGDKKTLEDFKKDLEEQGLTATTKSAIGNLFLFRYLDFAVEQGKTYRYRVRLELENPHFGLPPDELDDYALGEREVLETDWSEPSAPIKVPYDYEYFVSDVTDGAEAEADVNMFYWYYKSGTKTSADDDLNKSGLSVKVGDFVGGEKKTYVLRMDKETLNKETVVFESRDVLLGVSAPPVLDPSVLTDLKDEIAAMDRNQRKTFGARMTVAKPDGDVLTVTTPHNDSTLAKRRRFMEQMVKHFDGLGWKDREDGTVASSSRRNRNNRNNNPGDPGYGDYGDNDMGGPPPGYDGGSGYGEDYNSGQGMDGPPPGYGGGGPPPGYGGGGG